MSDPGKCPRCGNASESATVMGRTYHAVCDDCLAAAERLEADLARKKRVDAAMQRFRQTVARYPLYDPAQTDWDKIADGGKEAAKDWLSSQPSPTGLFLTGDSGAGKTRIVFAIMQRLAERGISSAFVRHIEVAQDAIGSATGDLLARSRIDDAYRADCLVFDDLGKAGTSEKATGIVYGLIEHYAVKMRPFIVTSQAGGQWLEQRFGDDRGEAIVRRIADFCRKVELKGKKFKESLAKDAE